MASKFPETPTNMENKVGIRSRRLFQSGSDRSGGFQPRLGNTGNHPGFVRIEPQTKAFVPALPQPATEASTVKSEENLAPLTIFQKPTSKYRPPDFISTVTLMRDKLYAVSDRCKYTEEPPEGDEFNAVWKEALKKESWFTDQNVSNYSCEEYCHLAEWVLFSQPLLAVQVRV